MFVVSSNRLSGTVPPLIFNLSSLEKIDVGLNYQIQGHLPSDIGITLPNIRFFSTAYNQFTGAIPVSISNATNQDTLQMNDNNFSGKVPSLEKLNRILLLVITNNSLGNGGENDLCFLCSLTNATNLSILDVNANNSGGELPKCIGNFSTTLYSLLLDNNKISGEIPIEIGNLISLERLEMWMNKLSGNISSEIGKFQKLQYLDLYHNNFSGNIPSSFGNLTIVTNLYLEENNLQGTIPLSLSKCKNLVELFLNNNNLSGLISPQVIGLSFSPIFLGLSSNQFTGVLPMEIGNFKILEYLNISENMLFGEIPTSLGSCVMLENLGMGRNLFQRKIPPSLEFLKGLQYLDLSNNNFSGQIPKFLEGFFYLQFLNLSFNHFEGEVLAKGVFKNTSATFINGNDKVCGVISKFQLPKCEYEKSKKWKLTLSLKLIISIFSGLLGVTLVLLVLLLRSFLKKRKDTASSDSGNFLLNLSYQNLLNVTDGFSSTNIIGAVVLDPCIKEFLIKVDIWLLLRCLTFCIMELPKVS